MEARVGGEWGRNFIFSWDLCWSKGDTLGEVMTFLDKMEYSCLGKTLLGGF